MLSAFFSVLVSSLAVVLPACTSTVSGLDTTFGTNGYTTVDFSGTEDEAHAVAIGSDGSIYVVGYTENADQDFAIAKLTSTGSLDTTFNTTGKASADLGGDDEAFAVALQSDGKIVAAGRSFVGSSPKLAVARWNTNGTLDTSFGIGGVFTTTIGVGSTADFRAVALDSSSRILIAGNAQFNTTQKFTLVRLTSAGAMDISFASSGIANLTPGTSGDYGRAMLVGSTRIVVAGTKFSATTSTGDFAMLGYTMAGVLDTTFGTSGITTFDFATAFPVTSGQNRDDTVYSMVTDSSGNYVLGGSTTDGSTGLQIGIARFTASGVLDTGFGTAGATMLKIQTRSGSTYTQMDGAAHSVKAGGTGTLIVGTSTTSGNKIALAKLSLAGSTITGFGTLGVASLNYGTVPSTADGSAVQTNGKLVVVGSALNSTYDFGVLRYSP